MAQQTVLITGASSGIGMELAREFAKHGHSLVLAARELIIRLLIFPNRQKPRRYWLLA